MPVEYGYAATGHSAQGLGADRVLLDKDAKARTTDHRSFYTDLTRAKQAAVIYTNDRSALPVSIVRQSQKTAALDVASAVRQLELCRDAARTTVKYRARSSPDMAAAMQARFRPVQGKGAEARVLYEA